MGVQVIRRLCSQNGEEPYPRDLDKRDNQFLEHY